MVSVGGRSRLPLSWGDNFGYYLGISLECESGSGGSPGPHLASKVTSQGEIAPGKWEPGASRWTFGAECGTSTPAHAVTPGPGGVLVNISCHLLCLDRKFACCLNSTLPASAEPFFGGVKFTGPSKYREKLLCV